jgi:hypothetical protein
MPLAALVDGEVAHGVRGRGGRGTGAAGCQGTAKAVVIQYAVGDILITWPHSDNQLLAGKLQWGRSMGAMLATIPPVPVKVLVLAQSQWLNISDQ